MPTPLTEAAAVIQKYIDTNKIDYSLIAPSFPSGGVIINKKDIPIIYKTGKGKVILRGKTEIKGNSIFITEMPYQVYVEPYIDKLKELIKKEEITGIEEYYNKSGKKTGLLIEIVCSSDPQRVLRQLYAKTDLQTSYSANQWALVGKTPKLLNLQEYCEIYIKHNTECIKKESEFDLKKATDRKHIIDGLLIALEDIDNVLKLIKSSSSSTEAKKTLISKYKLDDVQAQAILDMKLSKLAHLEKIELENEHKELISSINELNTIINSYEKQSSILKERLQNLVNKYGDKRRTQLLDIEDDSKTVKDETANIEPEKCVVVLTEGNTIKRIPAASFKIQKRAGKGIKTQDDITSMILRTNTIDSLMIFSNKGVMYRLLVNDIPEGTNSSKGASVESLVEMAYGEKAEVIYSIYHDTDAKYVLFTTKNGVVKKTALDEYTATNKKSGVAAIKLRENDSLVNVCLIKEEPIYIITKLGKVIKFNSKEITASSRNTIGLKGITLAANDEVITTLPIRNLDDYLALFSINGCGKKLSPKEFPSQSRGGKGFAAHKEEVVAASLISDEDTLLIVGDKTSICVAATDIPTTTKVASGNIIIKGKIKAVSKI